MYKVTSTDIHENKLCKHLSVYFSFGFRQNLYNVHTMGSVLRLHMIHCSTSQLSYNLITSEGAMTLLKPWSSKIKKKSPLKKIELDVSNHFD